MFSIALLSGTGESLMANRDGDPIAMAVLFALLILLVWTAKEAGTTIVHLFREAIAATLSAFKFAVIPIIVIGLLILAAA
jgi:hypothetical protein